MAGRRLLALSQLLAIALSQYTIDPQSCIDPSGFQSCYCNAQGGGQCQRECEEFSTSEDCKVPRYCEDFVQGINCILTHCWNQVYSCGYQALAVGTLQFCLGLEYVPPSPIPYFPAPANAPGGCSCNIGAAYASFAKYVYLGYQCPKFSLPGSNTCSWCTYSGQASSFADICPAQNTDTLPGYVNPKNWPGAQATAGPLGLGGCNISLSAATCKAYGIPTPIQAVIPSFYTAGAIPTAGTKSISNNPGSLTSPISGSVITWRIDQMTNVVTAAPGTATSGSTNEAKTAFPWTLMFLGLITLAIAQFS